MNRFKKNLVFLVLLIAHLCFLIFFPVFQNNTWLDIAGIISVFNVFNSLLYLTWERESAFSDYKHFLAFKISHFEILYLELKSFFFKFDTIILSAFTFLNINLKLNNPYDKFILNGQIMISMIGGLGFIFFINRIVKNLFEDVNIISFYFRNVIVILIFVSLSISNFYLPYGGIFFVFFNYIDNPSLAFASNFALLFVWFLTLTVIYFIIKDLKQKCRFIFS